MIIWLGSQTESWSLDHYYSPYSRLLVCPFCAKTWARISIIDEDYYLPTAAECGNCKIRHQFVFTISGSILNHGILYTNFIDLNKVIDNLPIGLVQREFNLTLKAVENELAKEATRAA